MTSFRLVWRNLLAHPWRSLLTSLSLAMAVFLLCLLQALNMALTAGVESSSATRLVVQSAVSLFVDLPQSYQPRIAQVPGVAQVCKFQWFGGIFQDPSNFFGQFGVDPDRLLDTIPEIDIIEGSEEAFLRDRRACLIGSGLARKFDWEVGETVPLIGTLFQRLTGEAWEFQVAGVYHSPTANVDNNTMYFHFAYLDESIQAGTAVGPSGATDVADVGVYMLRLEAGAPVEQVMADVDTLFESGPQRVQTTTEKEFQRQFVTMLGSVPTLLRSIGGGIVFAIVLAILNTMLMAARERTHDVGILKALGFEDRSVFLLMVTESITLCGLGGLVGVALAMATEGTWINLLGSMFPDFHISHTTVGLGLAGSLLVGVFTAWLPARQTARMPPVHAFREEA